MVRELSRIISEKVKDPRIGMLTVTGVTLTPDLKHAKVFVSTLGDDRERRDAMAGLSASAGFIRREVARAINMKSTPNLHFIYDEAPERGEKMMSLLNSLGNTNDDSSRMD